MSLKKALQVVGLLNLFWLSGAEVSALELTPEVNGFIELMVTKHQFERQQVEQWLNAAEIKEAILKSISAPAEGIPWYQYRKIFLTDKRINGGVDFWRQHQKTLAQVSAQYGVSAEIIIAIIGVETQYGGNVGNYRVIDALSTLGFAYPKRSAFFLSELEHFLLLCREEGNDPLKPLGSYAGAMGLPQFMPSSYRKFAVDFEHDQHRNIWTNPDDAIASVANYFVVHHWQTGQEAFVPALPRDANYQSLIRKELELDLTAADIENLGISLIEKLPVDAKVKLLTYQQEQGEDLWLGLQNYYVITRYNRSPLYALAVYQLSQAIADRMRVSQIVPRE